MGTSYEVTQELLGCGDAATYQGCSALATPEVSQRGQVACSSNSLATKAISAVPKVPFQHKSTVKQLYHEPPAPP